VGEGAKMAEEKIARIAREIYENVGGTQNVKKLIHCMTRVRMTIIDDSKVNLAGLKAIDGVMGVVLKMKHYKLSSGLEL